jgi:hypothetical protein
MHKNKKGRYLFDFPRFALGNMTRSEWEATVYDHYSWRVCPCPLICESGSDADEDDDEAWDIFNSCHWLWATIRFGNLWWNGVLKKWEPVFGTIPAFDIVTGKVKEKKGDLIFQQPYPIEKRIDTTSEKVDSYFEKTTYWLELPAEYHELEITLFPAKSPYATSYPTLFLPNIKLSKINIYNDNDFFEKANMSYHCGLDEHTLGINSKKYNSYLTSYKDNMFESFLSTLYKDKEGLNPVVLPAWRYTQTRSIVERPEYRIASIALYYISKMKTVSDVLHIENRLLSYLYGDSHLWENGCNISPLRDTVDTGYCFNILTYDTNES